VVDPVVKSGVFNSVGEAALLPEEVGGPVPIVAGSVEEPELPAKDIEQGVIVAVKPLAGEPATDAPESDFPVDPAVEEIPPVESESVEERRLRLLTYLFHLRNLPSMRLNRKRFHLQLLHPSRLNRRHQPRTFLKRSLKRPWTPLYSVSSQGGGLDKVAPADEEISELMIVLELPLKETAQPAPEIVTSTEACALSVSSPSFRINQFSIQEPVVAEPEPSF
jgi:hypothetical protein